jgi:hypothetical protein
MTPEERRQKIYAEINARAELMAREREKAKAKNRQPLTRKQKIMAWGFAIAMIIGLFALSYVLLGVLSLASKALRTDERQGVPRWELVEYIEVEGECAEDHVKESARYVGHLEHSRNPTMDYHFGWGHVTLRRDDRHLWLARSRDPYSYEPSFTIGFSQLRPEQLQGDVLHLAGLSEYITDEESRRPSYRATCTLRVSRRLDHRPSRQEETAQ